MDGFCPCGVTRDASAGVPVIVVASSRQRSPLSVSGPQSSSVTINMPVTMNIATADANSFNKSKDQISHDMAARLKRAIKKLGDPVVADDPTKRPA